MRRALIAIVAAILTGVGGGCQGCESSVGDVVQEQDPAEAARDGGAPVIACEEDGQCPLGEICVAGSCVAPDVDDSDDGCWDDDDCPPAMACAPSTGRCVEVVEDVSEAPDAGGPCAEGETRFCGSKVGACEYGVESCVDGSWAGSCEGGAGPTDDVCDGVDNDCDGETDEDFPDLAAPCVDGLGVCESDGVRVCADDGLSTTCDALAGAPSAAEDLCGNGLDDDCDGNVDEGFPDLGQPCEEGVGACQRGGVLECAASGTALVCSAVPGAPAAEELCGNGVDDDCDGELEEGFTAVGESCTLGTPPCQRTGTVVCTDDSLSTSCQLPPADGESCNGADDDDDACIDEDFDIGTLCAAGRGVCRTDGERICSADGSGTVCGAVPGAPNASGELCGNALDDDCNGEVDEGFDLGASCSVGTGVCRRQGQKVCAADGEGTICDATPGAPNADGELCGNGLDDDCDGEVDEGFDVGAGCSVGDGICASSGQKVCTADGLATTCDAVPGAPNASGELCGNDLDDDCDSDVDEGFDVGAACANGDGVCERSGAKVCSADRLSTTCDAVPGAPNADGELCGNGLDDDCDTAVDEGFDVGASCANGDGVCERSGAKVCSADRLSTTCDAVPGQPNADGELCGNGLDDDCDTEIDEGFDVGTACAEGDGVCARSGAKVCSADRLSTTCDAVPGAPDADGELCGNGLDDDCDTEVDEGFDVGAACANGDGVCERSGAKVCTADGLSTRCDAVPGAPNADGELCGNGLDDDCDTEVDEGFDVGTACANGDGVCERSGAKVCAADGLSTTCDAVPGPPNADGELCGNGLDDDCDTEVDEGFDVGAACANGDGVCERSGAKVCAADRLSTTCDAVPGPPDADGELCGNGLDDDCDTETDEGFDVGAACSVGDGICASSGEKVCTSDRLATECGAVEGAPHADGELCGNGADDDCDTEVDEGYDVGAACSVGDGICASSGEKICTSDRLATECGAIEGQPHPDGELCGNGLDDDCDKDTDEGFDVGAACTNGDGVCERPGAKVCTSDGRATECDAVPGDANPDGELCGNGLDDDCDKDTDEGFNDGDVCEVGVGACRATGSYICSVGGLGTECDASEGSASDELCDDIDNDCDGVVDNGCDDDGDDYCDAALGLVGTPAVCSLSSGGLQDCNDAAGGVHPGASEICDNGVDEDCDGTPDDGCDAPVAVCSPANIDTQPLATVSLDGTGSSDPNGGALTYNWHVLSAPSGSTSDPATPTTATTTFYVDLAGAYEVELIVTDAQGLTDSCIVPIQSVPPQDLHVQLVWQDDVGDLDLHLTKHDEAPLGAFFDQSTTTEKDCWWRNKGTDWGAGGSPDGDATLDIDDTNGNGPENINIDVNPANGSYHVGVHLYCDQSLSGNSLVGSKGPRSAKVRIYCGGSLVDEIPVDYKTLSTVGDFWIPAEVRWTGLGCEVTRIDSVEAGLKYCKATGACASTTNDCRAAASCTSSSQCRDFEYCYTGPGPAKNSCRLNAACTKNSDCPSGQTCDAAYSGLCSR